MEAASRGSLNKMFHPFIDTTNLSDDELLRRIQKCQEVVAGSIQYGRNSMVQSAMLQLETYRSAWEERLAQQRIKEDLEKNPPGVVELGTAESKIIKHSDK